MKKNWQEYSPWHLKIGPQGHFTKRKFDPNSWIKSLIFIRKYCLNGFYLFFLWHLWQVLLFLFQIQIRIVNFNFLFFFLLFFSRKIWRRKRFYPVNTLPRTTSAKALVLRTLWYVWQFRKHRCLIFKNVNIEHFKNFPLFINWKLFLSHQITCHIKMKFQFCGQQDCPDWILSEIFILSRLSSIKAKLFAAQVVQSILKGLFWYLIFLHHNLDTYSWYHFDHS